MKQVESCDEILTSSERIVCKETPITLSDEKLKRLLSSIYERARQDANVFHLYKHYGIFLSMGGSLLLTLLTTERFISLGGASGNTIRLILGIVCAVSLLFGLILAISGISQRLKNENSDRDEAINDSLREIIKENSLDRNENE